MTSFFPDLNVCIALSVEAHAHSAEAWSWLRLLDSDAVVIWSRYTHIGFLRLLTNQAVMRDRTLTLKQAWDMYERWLRDPRVRFYPEPRSLDEDFRRETAPFSQLPAGKWVGDCYLLA